MVNAPGLPALGTTLSLLILAGCGGSSGPPSNDRNACVIVDERGDWYEAAREAGRKWRVPAPVILAIIWRESSFRAEAQTPREYALGVIPWGRQSSAYGFAQAIDGTWEWYQEDHGGSGADRDDFGDASDFVGWYIDKTRSTLGIPARDARNQYLAYHEGHAGFKTGRWRQKAFLVKAANDVAQRTALYDSQLRGCDADYARERRVVTVPVPARAPFGLRAVSSRMPGFKPEV